VEGATSYVDQETVKQICQLFESDSDYHRRIAGDGLKVAKGSVSHFWFHVPRGHLIRMIAFAH